MKSYLISGAGLLAAWALSMIVYLLVQNAGLQKSNDMLWDQVKLLWTHHGATYAQTKPGE